MRTVRRKYGREAQESSSGGGATHRIKIGFDSRASGDAQPKPGKLCGFLINRDAVDPRTMSLLVDMEAMERLGVTEDQVELAKKQQLKAPHGTLPTSIKFVILHDAVRNVAGDWHFPGTIDEQFECYNKEGRFCYGDGMTATRKIGNGQTEKRPCVPFGATGEAPENYCPFSAKKECKLHMTFTLCLFVEGADGRPEPLCKSLGWGARFRLDTTSEYNSMRAFRELELAADRLNGRISQITGTISYLIQRKRTGIKEAPVGLVGQVVFALDEFSIRTREQQLHQRYLETAAAQQGRPTLAIEAPVIPQAEPVEIPLEAAEQPEPEMFEVEPDIEPETEPEAAPSETLPAPFEPMTDEQLGRWLSDHIQALSDMEGKPFGEVLAREAWIETDGRTFSGPKTIEYFFAAKTEETHAKRMAWLRAVCARIQSAEG